MLAEWLQRQSIEVQVSTATPEGGDLLPVGVPCQVGRLTQGEMAQMMTTQRVTHVVDATHPYATVVTANIIAATQQVALPYLRLSREVGGEGDWYPAKDLTHAAQIAGELKGNILLTTGSKELAPFGVDGLRERTVVRVLPTATSLELCRAQGFTMGQIVALQGPCSIALNEGMIDQYNIKIMVTKESGSTGGFTEKVTSAQRKGVALIVIERPDSPVGLSLEAMKEKLGGLADGTR